MQLSQLLAAELSIDAKAIEAVIAMLKDGDTIPFIARYRKEATGGLDDIQLRKLEERLSYVAEMEARRSAILAALAEQGVVDHPVLHEIAIADSKARLEDLYQPFKEKRRTKGQIAIEAGLLPLADSLLADPSVPPEEAALPYASEATGFPDATAALEGARSILAERFASDADLMGRLRDMFWKNGSLRSKVRQGQENEGAKFSDYFDRSERFQDIASHTALAMMRGERLGHLDLQQDPLPVGADPRAPSVYDATVRKHFGIADGQRPGDAWLAEASRWIWRNKIKIRLETDIRSSIVERAETVAISTFSTNLRNLLMAAPAGRRTVLALDPGYRNGVKCAIVDGTGKVLAHEIVHPHEGQRGWNVSLDLLSNACRRHKVELIAIGNGTASRETDKLAGEILKLLPELRMAKAIVSEAGASIYSASALASAELPELDVSIRGAVSIGRRLQDPLAELVKIDPKSIGVGQYQHDVSETLLSKALDAVVEDCVNAVGVDLNTASPHLLARVAGVGPGLAEAIVRHRDENGAFRSRRQLLEIPRLGEKTFQQCAGFLRIPDAEHPLDRSGVHPEAYPLVERMLADIGIDVGQAMSNPGLLKTVVPEKYVDERFGLPTVKDVLAELSKPGRDPRPSFTTATFKEGVEKPGDLKPGMLLEGTVSSVAAFGAFVDIGVHQDGLVHVSALSKNFVDDPHKIVKVGQTVRVKVMSVDLTRSRISLSMRLDDPLEGAPAGGQRPDRDSRARTSAPRPSAPSSAMAEALARAMKSKK